MSAVYLLSNACLAHAAESNHWAERRAAVEERRNGSTNKALPAAFMARLPGPVLELPKPDDFDLVRPLSSPDLRTSAASPSKKIPTWLSQLVLPHGAIREIHLARRADAPLVLHIQDLHGLYDAQKNVANILEALGGDRGLTLVGLEGAEGPLVIEPFRAYPEKDVNREVAEHFLKAGHITGPEYAGLTANKPLALFGVEDLGLYGAHIQALRTAQGRQKQAEALLESAQKSLAAEKDRIYSPALETFDAHQQAFQSEKENLSDYVRYLLSFVDIAAPSPNLRLLSEAFAREKALDFGRVENERQELIKALARKLNAPDMERLVRESMSYRLGRMSYGQYYAFLTKFCQDQGISLNRYESLRDYVAYVLLAEKINRDQLLTELARLEEAVPSTLAQTPAQKEIVTRSKNLDLLTKLLRHQMTPEDWSQYQLRRADVLKVFSAAGALLASDGKVPALLIRESLPDGETVGHDLLTPFEDFCRLAVARNEFLTRNLLARMKTQKARAAVLIAGGFHSEGLTRLLRDRDVSYVVITPNVGQNLDGAKNYLDVFARDPLPLEKILGGQPISLIKPPAHAPSVPYGVDGAEAVETRRAEHLALFYKTLDKVFRRLRGSGLSGQALRERLFQTASDLLKKVGADGLELWDGSQRAMSLVGNGFSLIFRFQGGPMRWCMAAPSGTGQEGLGFQVGPPPSLSGASLANAAGSLKRSPSQGKKVRTRPLLSRLDRILYAPLAFLLVAAHALFWSWWAQAVEVTNVPLFVAYSLANFYQFTALPLFFIFIIGKMKVSPVMTPEAGKRVAVIVTCVPGAESLDVVKRTLEALSKIKRPAQVKVDLWLLEDGPVAAPADLEIQKLAKIYGIHWWTRKGKPSYNQDEWPFQKKTKHGNVNAWLDEKGYARYDYMIQLDTDHAPDREILTETLGHFRDKDIGYVALPSIYVNTRNWISRGSAEMQIFLNGFIQTGLFGWARIPHIVGSNAAYRISALRDIGGYAPTRADDHHTTMALVSRGYRGVYVPKAMSRGLGPETLSVALRQEYQWAKSMTQVLLNHYLPQHRHLGWKERVGFLYAQTWYGLSGFVFTVTMVIPLWALWTSTSPFTIPITTCLAYILSILGSTVGFFVWAQKKHPGIPVLRISWRGVLFEIARKPIHLKAVVDALWELVFRRQKFDFIVTPKGRKFLSAAGSLPFKHMAVYWSLAGVYLAFILRSLERHDKYLTSADSFLFFALWWAAVYLMLLVFLTLWDTLELREKTRILWRRRVIPATLSVFVTGCLLALFCFTASMAHEKIYFSSLGRALQSPVVGEPLTLGPTAPALDPDQPRVDSQILHPENESPKDLTLGIYQPEGENPFGSMAVISHHFTSWDFPAQAFADDIRQNRVSLITFEPWPTENRSRAKLLDDILAGAYDEQFAAWARQAASMRQPFLLRFMHEANNTGPGGGYPWATDDTQKHIDAFRRVHAIFEQEGANEYAKWVWSPLVLENAEKYYPGDAYVDFVGVTALHSVYWDMHYGKLNKPLTSKGFFLYLKRFFEKFSKPVIFAETGNHTEIDERDEIYWRELIHHVGKDPQVRALVVYNWVNAGHSEVVPDWRLKQGTVDQIKKSLAKVKRFEKRTSSGRGGIPVKDDKRSWTLDSVLSFAALGLGLLFSKTREHVAHVLAFSPKWSMATVFFLSLYWTVGALFLRRLWLGPASGALAEKIHGLVFKPALGHGTAVFLPFQTLSGPLLFGNFTFDVMVQGMLGVFFSALAMSVVKYARIKKDPAFSSDREIFDGSSLRRKNQRPKDSPPFTWGLWTTWFGITPGEAVRVFGPRFETPLTFLIFTVLWWVLPVVFPQIPSWGVTALAALASQTTFSLLALTGQYVPSLAMPVSMRDPRAMNFGWLITVHLLGPGLSFHLPYFMLFGVVSTTQLDVGIAWMNILILVLGLLAAIGWGVFSHTKWNERAMRVTAPVHQDGAVRATQYENERFLQLYVLGGPAGSVTQSLLPVAAPRWNRELALTRLHNIVRNYSAAYTTQQAAFERDVLFLGRDPGWSRTGLNNAIFRLNQPADRSMVSVNAALAGGIARRLGAPGARVGDLFHILSILHLRGGSFVHALDLFDEVGLLKNGSTVQQLQAADVQLVILLCAWHIRHGNGDHGDWWRGAFDAYNKVVRTGHGLWNVQTILQGDLQAGKETLVEMPLSAAISEAPSAQDLTSLSQLRTLAEYMEVHPNRSPRVALTVLDQDGLLPDEPEAVFKSWVSAAFRTGILTENQRRLLLERFPVKTHVFVVRNVSIRARPLLEELGWENAAPDIFVLDKNHWSLDGVVARLLLILGNDLAKDITEGMAEEMEGFILIGSNA